MSYEITNCTIVQQPNQVIEYTPPCILVSLFWEAVAYLVNLLQRMGRYFRALPFSPNALIAPARNGLNDAALKTWVAALKTPSLISLNTDIGREEGLRLTYSPRLPPWEGCCVGMGLQLIQTFINSSMNFHDLEQAAHEFSNGANAESLALQELYIGLCATKIRVDSDLRDLLCDYLRKPTEEPLPEDLISSDLLKALQSFCEQPEPKPNLRPYLIANCLSIDPQTYALILELDLAYRQVDCQTGLYADAIRAVASTINLKTECSCEEFQSLSTGAYLISTPLHVMPYFVLENGQAYIFDPTFGLIEATDDVMQQLLSRYQATNSYQIFKMEEKTNE